MERQQEFSDLSHQQRAHLMQEVRDELEYERLKTSLALLARIQQSTDAAGAAGFAAAFEHLQSPVPAAAPVARIRPAGSAPSAVPQRRQQA
ncbi:hypothetical protein SLW73_04555 [Glutamicibacter protophormiae]|uniref:hypothetical protein n=2 Tax=Glutamicibacter protophormiae TaxID=37930 RepID=UPI002A83028F|nr:hypothetical protein [Glutamicibacter protophormiae]WPR65600.1 hypothetical protein SLW72_04555 [Glutamicibacter protophormiae]WPR69098.1 hypothetical protein SLW73_04555 [Glutamicibacter protophormiae]